MKPEVRIGMSLPREVKPPVIPSFPSDEMPRLAEIAKQVSALRAICTQENKDHVQNVITKPECAKILNARRIGWKISRMISQHTMPGFFNTPLLEEFKKEIIDTIGVLFSKHQQRQNKKKVSRAYPDLMHVSDRVSLVAVSQRARKDPLEGTPKRPKRKKVVRCM